jgi:hypothetical protein
MRSTPKVMVSLFSSPLGFQVIAALPPKAKFTAADFYGDIIPKTIEEPELGLITSTR